METCVPLQGARHCTDMQSSHRGDSAGIVPSSLKQNKMPESFGGKVRWQSLVGKFIPQTPPCYYG